jgi:SAM-dependent methyltransferase
LEDSAVDNDGPFLFEIRRLSDGQDSGSAYNRLYQEERLAQYLSYYMWLVDYMCLASTDTFLDVACGSGELVELAAQRGVIAYGIDFSETVVSIAHGSRRALSRMVVGSGENLPFPSEFFDTVANIGSLEHFVDPALGVREMARVLKRDAKAFILVPNTFSLLVNVWNALRKGVTSVDRQPIQRYGARADWVQLLEANGLQVCRTTKFERAWPRRGADWIYSLRHPKHMLRLLATPFVPLNLTFHFMFTCRRSVQP